MKYFSIFHATKNEMSKTDVHIPGLNHVQMCPNSDSDILKKLTNSYKSFSAMTYEKVKAMENTKLVQLNIALLILLI